MHIMTWDHIFGPVTGKRNPRHKLGTKFAEWRTLEHDTWFNGFEYAAGSRWRAFETENFGHVIFAPGTVTPNGAIPGRHSHRY